MHVEVVNSHRPPCGCGRLAGTGRRWQRDGRGAGHQPAAAMLAARPAGRLRDATGRLAVGWGAPARGFRARCRAWRRRGVRGPPAACRPNAYLAVRTEGARAAPLPPATASALAHARAPKPCGGLVAACLLAWGARGVSKRAHSRGACLRWPRRFLLSTIDHICFGHVCRVAFCFWMILMTNN